MTSSTAVIEASANLVPELSQHLELKVAQGIVEGPCALIGAQKSPDVPLICARSCEPPAVSVKFVLTLIVNPAPETAMGAIGDGVAVVPSAWFTFHPIPATDMEVGSMAIVPVAQSCVIPLKVAGDTVALLPVGGPVNVYP
jgi:hypothetical protein